MSRAVLLLMLCILTSNVWATRRSLDCNFMGKGQKDVSKPINWRSDKQSTQWNFFEAPYTNREKIVKRERIFDYTTGSGESKLEDKVILDIKTTIHKKHLKIEITELISKQKKVIDYGKIEIDQMIEEEIYFDEPVEFETKHTYGNVTRRLDYVDLFCVLRRESRNWDILGLGGMFPMP